ncbi:MAG: hypothetical protein KDA60_22035, partial [Planctomycetales bacterium]|nr:hypothetical protein [Planctomycetales bacterium]
LVLRTDCVATPLLVQFAAIRHQCTAASGLRALVADDFQPSIAYHAYYLHPFFCSLDATSAAAMFSIWARTLWALCVERGWPLQICFSDDAIQLLSHKVETPIGPLGQMLATPLVPPRKNGLARRIKDHLSNKLGRVATGHDVQSWFFSRRLVEWLAIGHLEKMVQASFYQEYFAASDPFFASNIRPFAPNVPLFLAGRTDTNAVNLPGLPSFHERFVNMTLPKVQTLRSWGWDIQLYESSQAGGTSFGGGRAQRWMLTQLAGVL